MKNVLISASVIAMGASGAWAAGLERSTQFVGLLFEEGNYAEFSLGGFNPDVQGTVAGVLGSGDMAPGYGTFSLGIKQSLSEKLDFALILDQPIGANVAYPASAAPYPFAGGTADVDSTAITALLRYKLPSNVSFIGGLRAQQVEGTVAIPTIGGYTMTADRDRKVGYVLGIAWEKPEIAARVALTYNSEIEHDLTAHERFAAFMPAAVTTTFQTKIPQSVNLEFQTGVAADTLLFGSIRWVDWSVFQIAPPTFANAPCTTPSGAVPCGPLAKLDSDYVTYTVGLGRKFSDQWSGAVILAYEPSSGDLQGNLGPTDGYRSIGLAATYKMDNVKITGGVRWVDIGDATTKGIGSQFTDNSGVGFGLRIGYSF